jgi:hypothetical protein
LANILETRINGTALLELTSKLPQVRNVQYINSITEEFMGIPQNLDSEKRKIAQYIIEQNKDIASIFLHLQVIYTRRTIFRPAPPSPLLLILSKGAQFKLLLVEVL